MARIRADLIGAVHVDGHVLWAGDTIPSGVVVHESLQAEAPKPAKKAPAKRTKKAADPEPAAEPEPQETPGDGD